MQRCFFFVIFLVLQFNLKAQEADIIKTELSLWYKNSLEVKAATTLRIKLKSDDSLVLDFYEHDIKAVRLKEGRLKSFLPYYQKNNKLIIKSLPKNTTADIYISYTMDLSQSIYEPYVVFNSEIFSLNHINIQQRGSLGIAGMFFPSINSDAGLFQTNISVPKGVNTGTIGLLGFMVDHEKDEESHFWNGRTYYRPEQFFLIIGKFNSFNPEKIDENYTFPEVNFDAFQAKSIQADISGLISFVQSYTDTPYTDVNFLEIDSLSAFCEQPYTFEQKTSENTPTKKEKRERAFLQYVFNDDSLRQAYVYFLYQTSVQGTDWSANTIDALWQKDNLHPEIINIKTQEWQAQKIATHRKAYITKDSVVIDSMDLDYYHSLMDGEKPACIDITYRYKQDNQVVSFTQDTSCAPLYNLPVRITIFTNARMEYPALLKKDFQQEVSWPLDGAPKNVKVNFSEGIPAFIQDNRPDSYNLYALSHAETDGERIEALRLLFKTSNPNLFSTALGIAMDDKNWKVRLEALQKAHSLNIAGQYKLKSTLIKIAEEDPHVLVKKEAQALVSKYYNN